LIGLQTAWLKLSVVAYLLLICMGRALNLAVPILYGKMIDVIANAGSHAPVPIGQVHTPNTHIFISHIVVIVYAPHL
jgi:hypothetical protein